MTIFAKTAGFADSVNSMTATSKTRPMTQYRQSNDSPAPRACSVAADATTTRVEAVGPGKTRTASIESRGPIRRRASRTWRPTHLTLLGQRLTRPRCFDHSSFFLGREGSLGFVSTRSQYETRNNDLGGASHHERNLLCVRANFQVHGPLFSAALGVTIRSSRRNKISTLLDPSTSW